jgi:hypothetical protein
MTFRRRILILALLGTSVLGVSATCLEHDSVRKAGDGNWHIFGEIHNETDVQGIEMALKGTLVYENGTQIVSDVVSMCPTDLSPGTYSVYDVSFENSGQLARPDDHKVNVVSGKVATETLPALEGGFTELESHVMNNGNAPQGYAFSSTFLHPAAVEKVTRYQHCTVFYDGDGEVSGLFPATPHAIKRGAKGVIVEASLGGVEPGWVEARFLLWRLSDDGSGASSSAVALSPPIAVPQ